MAPDPVSNEVLLEKLENLGIGINRLITKVDKLNGIVRSNENRCTALESGMKHLEDDVNDLEDANKRWDLINSVGVIVAGILGGIGIRQ